MSWFLLSTTVLISKSGVAETRSEEYNISIIPISTSFVSRRLGGIVHAHIGMDRQE